MERNKEIKTVLELAKKEIISHYPRNTNHCIITTIDDLILKLDKEPVNLQKELSEKEDELLREIGENNILSKQLAELKAKYDRYERMAKEHLDLNLALAAMLNGYQNLSIYQKDWFTVPKDLINEYTKMVLEYDVKYNEALSSGEGEKPTARDQLINLCHSLAEEVGKDAETAKAYLESEGIDMAKLEENTRFVTWLAELSKLLHEAASGEPVKINQVEARKWFDDGFTPYQCFRETWNME